MHPHPKPGGNSSPQRLNEGPLRRLFMIMTPIMPRGEWHARPGIYRNAIGKKRGLQLCSLSHSVTRACIWQILCVNKEVRDLRTRWGPQTLLSPSSAFYTHTNFTLSLLTHVQLKWFYPSLHPIHMFRSLCKCVPVFFWSRKTEHKQQENEIHFHDAVPHTLMCSRYPFHISLVCI